MHQRIPLVLRYNITSSAVLLAGLLQSYGGGRDIVGLGDSTLLQGQEFKREPIFDDGLIEVWVGGVGAPAVAGMEATHPGSIPKTS